MVPTLRFPGVGRVRSKGLYESYSGGLRVFDIRTSSGTIRPAIWEAGRDEQVRPGLSDCPQVFGYMRALRANMTLLRL